MPRLLFALTLAALLTASTASRADTYSFTISTGSSSSNAPGTTFVASGTLTGTPTSTLPVIDLTDVTGSAQGYSFTGVAPLSTPASFPFDNLLYTNANAQHVDASGILLYLTSPIGTSLAHVYEGATGYAVDVFDPNDPGDVTPFAIDTFTLNPSAVPEPSTLALLSTGALGMFGVVRRRLAL